MPLEALLIPDNLTDSDSDGINRGTGCNLYLIALFCSPSIVIFSTHVRTVRIASYATVCTLGVCAGSNAGPAPARTM